MSTVILTKKNIRGYVHCVLLHHEVHYAKEAVEIMARQWNHNQYEKERNLRSMIHESKDQLPCHIVLFIRPNNLHKLACPSSTLDKTIELEENVDVVIAHVKLARAGGRGDGSCCISYSLVVAEEFRGFGIGRILTEEAENYARSLNISYMYLSTNDKVLFYEHLKYKQCEPISSLGNNSKRLTPTQVSSLEGLFSKHLNICNPTNCNMWLRKRLIKEYTLNEPSSIETLTSLVVKCMESISYDQGQLHEFTYYSGNVICLPWQQQSGPSCGIAALNMIKKYLEYCHKDLHEDTKELCNCVGQVLKPNLHWSNTLSALDVALQLGISNDGELFCAYNLVYLSQKSHRLNSIVKNVNNNTPSEVYKSIKLGFPVLIPYDRSLSNHTPNCFDGKQAHWAVIIGIILPLRQDKVQNSEMFVCINESTKLCINKSKYTTDKRCDEITDSCLLEQLLIICMHGMSSKPFVCTWKDMETSNGQLNSSKSKFYLASENLKHLKDKIIFFDY